MKAISAVISILIFLLILMAVVSSAFIFFSDITSTAGKETENETETLIKGIRTSIDIETVDIGAIFIRNKGDQPVENTTVSTYIDDKPIEFFFNGTIDPGEREIINLSGILPAGDYEVKIAYGSWDTIERVTIPPKNVLKNPTFATPREPVDIMLIIDRSGSMDDDCSCANVDTCTGCSGPCRICHAKSAAATFLGFLGTSDRSGLVSFSDTVTLDQGLTTNPSLVENAVNAITTGGYTALGDGIGNATEELVDNGRADIPHIQIVLSDGDSNRGSDPLTRANEAASEGVIIYTIGLGSGANEAVLQSIADATGGEYYFAPSGAQLEDIYAEIAQEVVDVSWVKKGAASVGEYGSYCYSGTFCAKFHGGVYPNTLIYQDIPIYAPGTYKILRASAVVNVSGSVCTIPNPSSDPNCAQLVGNTCRDNDARVHLIAFDDEDNVLDEILKTAWSTVEDEWSYLEEVWTTPANTAKIRFQIDAGDCCDATPCETDDVYIDDIYMSVSTT